MIRRDIGECESEAKPSDSHRPRRASEGPAADQEHREACRAMAICPLQPDCIPLCRRGLRQESSRRVRTQGASGDAQPKRGGGEVYVALQ